MGNLGRLEQVLTVYFQRKPISRWHRETRRERRSRNEANLTLASRNATRGTLPKRSQSHAGIAKRDERKRHSRNEANLTLASRNATREGRSRNEANLTLAPRNTTRATLPKRSQSHAGTAKNDLTHLRHSRMPRPDQGLSARAKIPLRSPHPPSRGGPSRCAQRHSRV